MKIQFDITEDENEIICIVKARERFKNKADAIKHIIKMYGEQRK